MPHTKSAKKRLRQNAKRHLHNLDVKKGIKVQIKKFRKALDKGNKEDILKEFRAAVRRLDKAGARRILHPNSASRKKAQLAHLLNDKLAAQ